MEKRQFTREELEKMLEEHKKAEVKEQKEKEEKFNKAKEDFLINRCNQFIELSKQLKALKTQSIKEANNLNETMYKIHGKEVKQQKKFEIKSDDFKFVVETQDRFEFTPEAIVHIEAIKEILKNKFYSRNKGHYNFLEKVLMKNSNGDFDPKLLVKGRKEAEELGDPNLIQEYEKLQKCQRVYGSALYCRAYQKDTKQRWELINIQFSSM